MFVSLCVQAHVHRMPRDPVSRSLPLPGPLSGSLWARVSPSIRDRLHFDHTSQKLGARGRGGGGDEERRVECSTRAERSRVVGLATAPGLTPPCSTFEVPHCISDGRGKGELMWCACPFFSHPSSRADPSVAWC